MPDSSLELEKTIAETAEFKANLGDLLRLALARLESDLTLAFSARGELPIKKTHLAILLQIEPQGSRISELAEQSGLSDQTIGPRVREMLKLGLVEQRPDPSDGRAKLVVLTPGGIDRMMTSARINREVISSYTDVIGRRRMSQLFSTLTKLTVLKEPPAEL